MSGIAGNLARLHITFVKNLAAVTASCATLDDVGLFLISQWKFLRRNQLELVIVQDE